MCTAKCGQVNPKIWKRQENVPASVFSSKCCLFPSFLPCTLLATGNFLLTFMLTDGHCRQTEVAYINYKLIGLEVNLLIVPDFRIMLLPYKGRVC